MLQIRALSERDLDDEDAVDRLFGPRFLVERPLLQAVRAGDSAVLLVDEVDRADDEFEAFLLELLSDFQVTIPEIGTIAAQTPPVVVLTSNRTRELHDALKRRCLYHWVGYPSAEQELEIVLVRAPGASEQLARKVVAAVNRLRELDLSRPPGVAETIDWVRTLEVVGADDLDAQAVRDTLGAVVKDRDDAELVRASAEDVAVAPDGSAGVDVEAEQPFAALLVDFAREVRAAGVGVGTGDAVTYCAAMAPLDPTDLLDLYWAGRTTLVTRREDIPVYDRVFRAFFLSERTDLPEPLRLSVRAQEQAQGVLEVPLTEPGEQSREEQEARLGLLASDVDVLRHKAFSTCTPEELAAVRRIMRRHAADAATPPDPPDRARQAGSYPGHAAHDQGDDARARGAGAAVLARASPAGAAAGPHPGRVRVDGRLLAAPAAVRVLGAAVEHPGRGLLLRDPAHPADPGAAAPPPGRGDRARRRRRRRLGRRHPDR